MNSQYSWKDGLQIDPSFSRNPDLEFVVGDVTLRPEVAQHQLVSPVKKITNSALPSEPLLIDPEDPAKDKAAASRRPVSTTKRAAQNRNAQKAFRQRREKYVKELEATAAEVAELHKTIEELRQENLQLRDYTLALQSRLIELSPNVTVGNVAHPQPQEFNKL